MIPMVDLVEKFSKLPVGCKLTVVFDSACAYFPNFASNGVEYPATYAQFAEPQVPSSVATQRYLSLPPFPLKRPHQANGAPSNRPVQAKIHVLSGCYQTEACAEFPIEGVQQGMFTYCILEAVREGQWMGSIENVRQFCEKRMSDMKGYHPTKQNMFVQVGSNLGPNEVFLV